MSDSGVVISTKGVPSDNNDAESGKPLELIDWSLELVTADMVAGSIPT